MDAESLIKVVEELQNERAYLEQKLKSVRDKRRELESTDEQANAKYQQVSDTNSKLTELLKVAHHKVDQVQKQKKIVEEEIQKRRSAVEIVNSKIEEEKLRKEQSRKKFEEGCEKMSLQLLEAKQFYTDECLMNELDKVNRKSQSVEFEAQQSTNQVGELERLLDQVKLEDSAKSSQHLVPPHQQHLVMKMLLDENEALMETKRKMDEKTRNLRAELDQITVWRPPTTSE